MRKDVKGPDVAMWHREIVVVVHGYANSANRARSSYEKFEHQLASARVPDYRIDRIWWLLWPSDTVRVWKVPDPGYSLQIGRSEEAARRLLRYLLTSPQTRSVDRITFIAHSLGCKLILHLLSELKKDTGAKLTVPAICLMAAAVPVNACETDAAYGSPPLDRNPVGLVLHSSHDKVLRKAFPLGETLGLIASFRSTTRSWWPQAVGLRGEPSTRWQPRTRMPNYDHGDYFVEPESAAQVARLFGVAVDHRLDESGLIEDELIRWERFDSNQPEAWRLPERRS